MDTGVILKGNFLWVRLHIKSHHEVNKLSKPLEVCNPRCVFSNMWR
jgi:hypothetical protein